MDASGHAAPNYLFFGNSRRMSYDLYLIRVTPGATSDEVEALALAAAEEDYPTSDPPPETEARNQSLVAALRAVNPALEPFAFDYPEIARSKQISEPEARRRYRHTELNGPENGPGVQITLYDDWASVTLPYWHRGAAADAVWDEVWGYLQVLAERGGFTVYDPQLERPLDLSADRPAAQRMYSDGVAFTARTAAEITAGSTARKPWWKFW